MKSGNISHQIIKSVSCNSSGTVQINSIKVFHDFCVIRDLKIRNNRLSEFFNLNVFTIIFSNRYCRINDIRNYHHILQKLFFYFFFSCRKFINTCSGSSHLLFNFLCLFAFSLSHQSANLFGNFISLSS